MEYAKKLEAFIALQEDATLNYLKDELRTLSEKTPMPVSYIDEDGFFTTVHHTYKQDPYYHFLEGAINNRIQTIINKYLTP